MIDGNTLFLPVFIKSSLFREINAFRNLVDYTILFREFAFLILISEAAVALGGDRKNFCQLCSDQ